MAEPRNFGEIMELLRRVHFRLSKLRGINDRNYLKFRGPYEEMVRIFRREMWMELWEAGVGTRKCPPNISPNLSDLDAKFFQETKGRLLRLRKELNDIPSLREEEPI
ncbi:hypothetical protein COV42_02655 [Candidatus Campbellbacteria bacterium CG11_big_fil_rev_8_21_14_0_20_44_21]|uniref:Uncharacterized protein n=1 Tax=Candidatus Campbellbacteria bacterium CG22_combo_CG10-13_8_21_14_all_43_18 TaxID=1974530 RepID=A0A2H0DXA9_9BACT|nr:MAG: hypothetical protein COW82_00030 [Candidatus Campbellbacteria bacterium CG22_combo_CG10-13_8_21_14_all_43_18]PIR24081.1 MAG: hypothetical protein COV42_02655 [Candidatus Campbellbacteria bacterium CG11_big_fil_rev_8_21_14_0_20_44_21]